MGNYLCRMRRNPAFVELAADSLEDQYQQVHYMAWSARIVIRDSDIL